MRNNTKFIRTVHAFACKTSPNRFRNDSADDFPLNTIVRTKEPCAPTLPCLDTRPSFCVHTWKRILGAANILFNPFFDAYTCPAAPNGTAHATFALSSSHRIRCVVKLTFPPFNAHPVDSSTRSVLSKRWHSTSPCSNRGLPLPVSSTGCNIFTHGPSMTNPPCFNHHPVHSIQLLAASEFYSQTSKMTTTHKDPPITYLNTSAKLLSRSNP